jgi:tetratricopeptide (TPR) repeat protein
MQELAALQQESNVAMLALVGGGLRPPDEVYERYLGLARRLVAGVADFEKDSQGTFDVGGLAQPLVLQLSIYADHRQNAGDAEAAKRLRQEADDLTVSYLGPAATAMVRRTRAMEAAMEGRFHDALMGLADARTTFAEAGMLLDKVQTDVQLASIYEWLGDYERALATLQAAHDEVAPQLAAGPPSTAQVAESLERQLTGMMRGQDTREGEEALALQRIAYEVIQGEARNNRFLGNYDEAERLFLDARPFIAAELGIPAASTSIWLSSPSPAATPRRHSGLWQTSRPPSTAGCSGRVGRLCARSRLTFTCCAASPTRHWPSQTTAFVTSRRTPTSISRGSCSGDAHWRSMRWARPERRSTPSGRACPMPTGYVWRHWATGLTRRSCATSCRWHTTPSTLLSPPPTGLPSRGSSS